MNRIVFSLFAFAFVQLVSSQDACTTAQTALATNAGCVAAFASATDTSAICMGACRDLFNDIISNCDAAVGDAYSAVISTLCDGGTNTGAACAAATTAILADTTCETEDSAVLCTGSCRALADNFLNACPADDATVIAVRTEVNRLCGSGSMLKASGVITLLIVAVCTFIF